MATLLAEAGTLRALSESLKTLDPLASAALVRHMSTLANADAALRESNIKLAELAAYRIHERKLIRDIGALRNQIDLLTVATTQTYPISQQGGD